MSGLFNAFLIWPGMPLVIVIGTIIEKIQGGSGRGAAVGVALLCIFASSLITWAGVVALAVSYDNWWILGGGVGLALLVQTVLGDFIK